MKLTQVLCHQHIGRMVKRHWLNSAKKILPNDEMEAAVKQLEKVNPTIVRAEEHFLGINKSTSMETTKNIPTLNLPKMYSYSTDSLLIEGVRQAQVLTKSVSVENLPSRYVKFLKNLTISDTVHEKMEQDILSAHLFDAEQKKTKRIYDPQRPAFNFPRVYGITEERKNILILDKLIRHCERLTTNKAENLQKRIIHEPFLKVNFEKDGKEIGMDLLANLLITSTKPIAKVAEVSQDHEELPDLFPLNFTSSLKAVGSEGWEDFYPINTGHRFTSFHTIFPTFTSEMKTFHEVPINESQIRSRTLFYAFTAAAAKAKRQFGDNVQTLPEPIVVQAIHTNGQSFHFGVFQLNTLDLCGQEGDKNVWHESKIENLYSNCAYVQGKPQLEGYNPGVLEKFFTFYSQ
ncbi:large ribosomal subunit protein mL37 [Phlebotomus argentipes]|uniref:large ribosomal subunit protein mL37 n=1 Tax=Phlebotomus argentipes TaxID=94469 RepID=UPI002892C057|nr:large ribosomal subunit protein mL37 [Phlebotomus argentipes]